LISHNSLVNPKKIHIFSVVAELRNITHAAHKLHLSQPALSNSLTSLEQFFEAKLYEITGRTVTITDAGKRLLTHWSNIESCYQKMNDELGAIKHGDQGDISITMVSTAKYFTPALIKEFSRKFPRVNFNCQIIDRKQIIENLLNHHYAIGVLTEPPHHHALNAIKLGNNPLVFICHPKHQLANQSNVSFDILSQQNFITREHSAQITQNLYRLFEQHKLTPNIAFTINSTEAIKEAVIENLGIALMPYLAVHRELASKKIERINFETDSLTNNWYIITAKNKTLDSASQAFIKMTQIYFEKNINSQSLQD
jgi:DNA-binding transcriptional LysR family regulator